MIFKLALFIDENSDPVWVGNIQDLREANETGDVEDAIQEILDGADEATIGGGASPMVRLRLYKEDSNTEACRLP